jgi:hypothetical protein
MPRVLSAPLGLAGIAALSGFFVVTIAAVLPPRRRTGPNERLNDVVFHAIRWLGILISVSAVPAAAAVAVLALRQPHPSPLTLLYQAVAGSLAAGCMTFLVGGLVIMGADRMLFPPHAWGAGAPVLFIRSFDDEFATFRAGDDATKPRSTG